MGHCLWEPFKPQFFSLGYLKVVLKWKLFLPFLMKTGLYPETFSSGHRMMVCLGQRGEEGGEFLLLVFSVLWGKRQGLIYGGK